MNGQNKNIIAVYGGSFNPVHNGHVQLAQKFIDKLSPDLMLVIPTAAPPHKTNDNLVSSAHRLNMCSLAFQSLSCVKVSNMEIERSGKSYTIDTLHEITALYPNSQIYLIIGADMFLSFKTWKQYKEILNMAVLCTVPRTTQGYSQLLNFSKELEKDGGKFIILPGYVQQVSSTMVRNAIEEKQPINNMVSNMVADYIYKNKLYGCD